MSNQNSKTRSFDPVGGENKGNKDNKRQRLIIAIFVVIIAILALMSVLIGAEIIKRLPDDSTTTTEKPTQSGNSVYLNGTDVKKGDLLLIDKDSECSADDVDLGEMVNVKEYQSDAKNSATAKINGKYTYSLSFANIYLSESALRAFNKMVLDYCKTIDTSKADDNSASNLEIAWGGYSVDNPDEYESDLASESTGKSFYDHILGNSLTLKKNSDHTRVNEKKLKDDFLWIYEHAHEYGFILRYPNACSEHTGFDSEERVHLRYVGVAHATYIYEQEICLDEYIDKVKEYSYQNPLTVEASGNTYLVYYVKQSNENPTNVPLPENTDPENYTVSGNNIDGFVVTVKK